MARVGEPDQHGSGQLRRHPVAPSMGHREHRPQHFVDTVGGEDRLDHPRPTDSEVRVPAVDGRLV